MDIQMELNERANQINRILESYLPEEEGFLFPPPSPS